MRGSCLERRQIGAKGAYSKLRLPPQLAFLKGPACCGLFLSEGPRCRSPSSRFCSSEAAARARCRLEQTSRPRLGPASPGGGTCLRATGRRDSAERPRGWGGCLRTERERRWQGAIFPGQPWKKPPLPGRGEKKQLSLLRHGCRCRRSTRTSCRGSREIESLRVSRAQPLSAVSKFGVWTMRGFLVWRLRSFF